MHGTPRMWNKSGDSILTAVHNFLTGLILSRFSSGKSTSPSVLCILCSRLTGLEVLSCSFALWLLPAGHTCIALVRQSHDHTLGCRSAPKTCGTKKGQSSRGWRLQNLNLTECIFPRIFHAALGHHPLCRQEGFVFTTVLVLICTTPCNSTPCDFWRSKQSPFIYLFSRSRPRCCLHRHPLRVRHATCC